MRVLARRASHGEGAHVVALRKRHAVVLRKGHVVALAQGFCWGLHRAHPNQGDMYCGDGARVFAAGRVLFRGRFCDFPGTILLSFEFERFFERARGVAGGCEYAKP